MDTAAVNPPRLRPLWGARGDRFAWLLAGTAVALLALVGGLFVARGETAPGDPGRSASLGTAPGRPPGGAIVGSWIVTAEGAEDGPPRLFAFTADGVLLVSNGGAGTAAGAWETSGDRAAAFTFVEIEADANGEWGGLVTWRGTAEVAADGLSWTRSSLVGERLDRDGTSVGGILLPEGPRQLRAQRVVVEAVPFGGAGQVGPSAEPGEPGYAPATPEGTPEPGSGETTIAPATPAA